MSLAQDQPYILIIGAGAAGIAAGSRLLQNGFENVTILEADDVIGGRVRSVNFGGATVDLGAQWVHGEKGNTVYDLVKHLNVLGSESKTDYQHFSFLTSSGDRSAKNDLDSLYSIAINILEDVDSFCEHGGCMNEYFQKHYMDQVRSTFGNRTEEILPLAEMMEEWISKFVLCFDPANSWDQIHSDGFKSYEFCAGNQLLHWKDRGYVTALNVLMGKYPGDVTFAPLQDKILLNKFVLKIVWNASSANEKNVKVFCADGSVYHADHLINTVSVAALDGFSWFTPEVPEEKVVAARKIPLGNVVKVFLKFREKFWTDTDCSFCFLWSEKDKNQFRRDFPASDFTCRCESKSWLEDLLGFYSVESDPNILLGWFVGSSTYKIEKLPLQVLEASCMMALRKFLGKDYKIPNPESIIRSTWGSSPNFQGAYSYVGPETVNVDELREVLAKPLCVDGKEVVLFAGEALDLKHFSTVHGAIDTGFRAADRLINTYRKPREPKVVIIGAGMAGLGAATQLMRENLNDFLILEVGDKAGGRIHTILVDDKPLDLGAQWLHGKHNPLYDLAVKYNHISDEMSEEGRGRYVRSNGEVVDEFLVKKFDFQVGQILEECKKFVDMKEYPTSVGAFLEEKLNAVNDTNSNETDILKELYDWHVRFQIVDNSCSSLAELSAKGWGTYECIDDIAHYNIKHGYQALVDSIVDDLPKNNIKYNTEVVEIGFSDENKVVITFANRQTMNCDHLILTPSLGVLKSIPGLTSILPERTLQSVEKMGFASICKIYLFFEERWWGNSGGFQLLWTRDCTLPEKDTWLRHVTGFDEVFNHPNALMTWVGDAAVDEVENMPEDEIGDACFQLLLQFLPNYSIPRPSRVIRTKWLSNRFVRGSYCHITPKCDDNDCGIRQLKEPVVVDGVPRIVLAGEAVQPSHYSTTHGAFESGQEQAHVLAEYINAVSR